MDASALPPLPLSPPGTGMQSEVIRSGKPMRFGDVAQRVKDPRGRFMHVGADGSTRELGESEPSKTQSAIMVPVLLDGQGADELRDVDHLVVAHPAVDGAGEPGRGNAR